MEIPGEMSSMSKSAKRVYKNSFRWLAVAVVINAFLLAYGLVAGDSSTPPEVTIADIMFLGLSISLLPFCVRRNKWGLFGTLILGFLLILRSVGDPDFEEAFEEPLSRLPELAYFALFTIFSFVQTLSAHGAIILRKAGIR